MEKYTHEIALALDKNDSIEAIKLRAKQKELEYILDTKMGLIQVYEFDRNQYYSQKETIKVLGKSQSQVSKLKKPLEAIVTSDNELLYPKVLVNKYKEKIGK